jgi:asparagine synthase (glutamine-hydrolysing)
MCGIAGLFRADGALPSTTEWLDAMCRAIVHRGPDDQGMFAHGLGHIGMRRLSIIDLHTGHQPIANEDQSIWVVFNGEIYNFAQLRLELQGLGHRFSTDSDTECIVHAYEAWGPACFERLRGMFAVALLDIPRRRLVLARDRLGKKPLYHTRLADGTLAFCSELKSLFALPGFAPRVSATATRDYFSLGYVPGPASIYEGVHKLPGGCAMVVDADGEKILRYWSPPFAPGRARLQGSEDELADQLLAELDDAVRVRLVSDVPFGAFLSGGLDSSVVAALMARHLEQPVKTFSIGFQEAAFNELPDARRVAQAIGAEHHEFTVQADAVAMLDRLAWHFDEPFGDASAIPTFLVAQMAARHVKMVLSGDGGDELFAGYERYQRYLRLRRWRDRSLGLVGPALSVAGRCLPGARATRLARIGDRLRQPWPDDYLSGVALSTAADLRQLLSPDLAPADPYASVREPFGPANRARGLDGLLAGDMATYLTEDILVKVDRMTMANSLEARSPLLDHQLLDFAARLPDAFKLDGHTGKRLLKRVARRLLPAEVLDKPKQGFAIPLAEWLRGPLRPLMEDTLASRAFKERGIYHVPGVLRLWHRHLEGRQDHSEHLWLVLNYEAWAQRFAGASAGLPHR